MIKQQNFKGDDTWRGAIFHKVHRASISDFKVRLMGGGTFFDLPLRIYSQRWMYTRMLTRDQFAAANLLL